MLLEHDLPVTGSNASYAAAVWHHRERIEREAALQFDALARELAACGHHELAARSGAAAEDERRHAVRCRSIVDTLTAGSATTPPIPARHLALGPATLAQRDRMLYAAVAIGCVTESLSCSLLLELRAAATHELVADTVADILRHEIEHARIGWAVLAAEAAHRDVGWIAAYLPAMGAAAVADDVTPMAGDSQLAGFGVLPLARVRELVAGTWAAVIAPGMARYGIAG